jgi:hypothetical protein
MRRGALAFVDRLAERGLVDRFGFLCFAFGGAALIVLAKAFSVPPLIVAVAAAMAIVAYAVLVQGTGTGRLRSDQAGDNCYYLGLIYTLASLAYAIFTFDPADTATTIIQGFGVALATTIIGLVLRVYFNQSRPDIAESETSARLELAAASGKLKSELSRSIVSMNDFSRQTRQSLEELRDEVVASVQQIKDAAELSVKETSERASTAMAEHAEAAVARSKKLTNATDKIVGGMERHTESLSGLDSANASIVASLAALEGAAGNSKAMLDGLVTQTGQVSQIQSGAAAAVRDLTEAASALRDQVGGMTASTDRLEGVLLDKIEQVQAVPQAVAKAAISAVEEAIERLRADLQSIVDAQSKVVEGLNDQMKHSAETAGRHNAALETELTRSRDNVAKVHSALVDMTGALASRAEARA